MLAGSETENADHYFDWLSNYLIEYSKAADTRSWRVKKAVTITATTKQIMITEKKKSRLFSLIICVSFVFQLLKCIIKWNMETVVFNIFICIKKSNLLIADKLFSINL